MTGTFDILEYELKYKNDKMIMVLIEEYKKLEEEKWHEMESDIQVDALEDNVTDLESDLSEARDEIKTLEDENETLKEKVGELEGELGEKVL